MSIQESIRIVPKGSVAFVEFDLLGEKVNKLSSPVMVRFKEVFEELRSTQYGAVVLISRKTRNFIAGADIEEIKKLSTKEAYLEVLKKAHAIFNAFEDLPIPTIAAIHGTCLGGGCELVLAADYRLCSDSEETKIGLPEVKLGILPGFGGCVRLPRLVGLQAALDIILAGKSVEGRKALKIGLVDECVPAQLLESRALQLAEELIAKAGRKRRRVFQPKGALPVFLESFVGRPLVFSQAKKALLSQTRGFYPAPLKALEIIQQTYGWKSRAQALEIEMNGFTQVAVTDVSKNLIDLFFMMESIKKQTGVSEAAAVRPRVVSKMAVLGAGTMGGGIAQVAADREIDVRMKDISLEALAIGFKQAHSIFKKDLERRKITRFALDKKMGRISGGTEYVGFKSMDVVVEAIVEDMAVKKKVIAEVAGHTSEKCVMATNTSSLSVTEMAEAWPHPENFVGMHFFNPVNKMPLVEIIRGAQSSDEATATVFELAKKMGKTPVVVRDGPGFLVNRLLMPWLIETLFILEEGGDVEEIDKLFTHKFGMPMGPFRLMDEVGLDVCLKVIKIFNASLGERVQIPDVSVKLKECGRLGKKNKKGFYLYDDRGKQLQFDPAVYLDLGVGAQRRKIAEKEILERGLFLMINEASVALLEDHIVDTPQSVDLAMIMGTGFPAFRGGILKYADSLGSQYIVQELELYASRLGIRFKPSLPLQSMAKSNRKFY